MSDLEIRSGGAIAVDTELLRAVAGRLREFDPGWVPSPLRFTASWLGEPGNELVARAARMAQEVATAWDGDKKV